MYMHLHVRYMHGTCMHVQVHACASNHACTFHQPSNQLREKVLRWLPVNASASDVVQELFTEVPVNREQIKLVSQL